MANPGEQINPILCHKTAIQHLTFTLVKRHLPVGSLFVAAMGNERVLFRLAAQLEKENPWFDKVPEV